MEINLVRLDGARYGIQGRGFATAPPRMLSPMVTDFRANGITYRAGATSYHEARTLADFPTGFLGAAANALGAAHPSFAAFLDPTADLFCGPFDAPGLRLWNERETGYGRHSHRDSDSHNQSYE